MTESKNRMRNTHILTNGFNYLRPTTVADAVAALAEAPNATLLAGGTNLLVDMKLETASPETVIDLSQLHELHGWHAGETGLNLGALTRIRDLAVSKDLWTSHTCLAEAAAAFGSTQIMMMGTLGGNLANGSPASDTVPALVVLGAEASLAGPKGERHALVADLLEGPGKVALDDGELIRSLRLPTSPGAIGSAFLKLSRVRADLAKVLVAVRLVRDGDRIVNARIALGSVGPTVVRAKKASSMLRDQRFSGDLVLNAARVAAEEISPIDDVRSTALYRRRATLALVHDALQTAWERAGDSDWSPPMATVKVGETEPPPQLRAANVSSDALTKIHLTVNGESMELDVAPNELLLNVLRERLELTGSKYGCGIGECGACTIWLNGAPVLGCLVLAVAADGGAVRTIEGLAGPNGQLDPIQEAFIEENAFQCGYCTPGMLMMTRKLLDETPAPSEADVRDYLKGNHCRCTGYASIVRAIQRASGEVEG